MPNLSLLIKPSSSKCNIACTYCFYNDVSNNRTIKDYGFMSIEYLDILIKQSFDYVQTGHISIAFQGGEPLIIGLSFYEELIKIVDKYKNAATVSYSMQTNGLFIDEKIAIFFKKHNFLIGISIDGYKETHNKYRKTHKNGDTFKLVMEKTKILERFQVEFNILTVVSPTIAKHITKVYNTYKKENFNYLQFIIPIANFNEISEFALSDEQLFQFLDTLFKLWSKDFLSGNYISIRYFDNLINSALGRHVESCNMQGKCHCQFVVESNLDTFPCDFYSTDQYKIGNLKENSILDMLNSKNAINFIETSLPIPEECKNCKYYALCKNGCRRERHNNKNLYCNAYKKFFQENESIIRNVCLKLQNYNQHTNFI